MYFILFLSIIITMGSQLYINLMYGKTKKILSSTGKTGYDVARSILDSNGLKDVKVIENSGVLTDHYDPRNKTVSLSSDIYKNSSLASVSVAAHECGHAIQDKDGYVFLRFRSLIVPFVNIASKLGYVVIMISLFTSLFKLLWIGIFMELFILFFQIITLPVEFNASSRALKQIKDLGIVSNDEKKMCKKMLKAAALTYVASVFAAILEIVRLVLIARERDR